MQNFRRISIWEKGHAFTLKIYKLSQSFPKEETYGLTSQLRRASTSIPTNIAEGCGRSSDAEFIRFLYISMGSAMIQKSYQFSAISYQFVPAMNQESFQLSVFSCQ